MSRREEVVTYNGSSYGRVSCRMSMVMSAPAQKTWKIAAQFGNQGSWLGRIDGHPISTQLLGGQSVDYVGAVRVVSIAGKLIFERLTKLDSHDMVMEWHIISHPLATNPFPASLLNCKACIRLLPVLIPGNQCFVDWKVDLLTELHNVDIMRRIMEGMMRVGLLNIQRHFTLGGRPPVQKKLMQRHPSLPPIPEIPLPAQPMPTMVSAFSGIPVPEEKQQDGYMSAPEEEQQVMNADRVDHAASYMEMTVPLLHEAMPARTLLTDMSRPRKPQCGAMSREQLSAARSGVLPRQPDVVPPPVPQPTEGMQREPSTELCGDDATTERSSSVGDSTNPGGNMWPSVAALRLARSASQPLD
ncbi:g13134 [Coccomyxa viridis]|uniref:G13134 protein n=1 Tax=Coccomyxa viridis TaxID=1274662 RepID=A0ABP1GG68_9CHLO